MMSEAKPLASLSADLLARKGSARPAMRPQLYTSRDESGSDGIDVQPQRAPTVISLRPQVVRPTVKAQPARSRAGAGTETKRAFTLRLDTERHLKLRSTSKHSHRSAQSLVTEALDRFLAGLESGSN